VGAGALRVVFAEENYLVRAGTAALLAEVDGTVTRRRSR
jgi:hypothetical protein